MPVSITATTMPLPVERSQAGRMLMLAAVAPIAHCCGKPGSLGTSSGRIRMSTSTRLTAGSAARRRIRLSESTRSSLRSATSTIGPPLSRRVADRPSAFPRTCGTARAMSPHGADNPVARLLPTLFL